jgi:hypothetical protein
MPTIATTANSHGKQSKKKIKIEDSGLSSSYYITHIPHPVSLGAEYSAECLDIMEVLDMTVHESNIFKAIWRKAAERQGNVKANNSAMRDCEKAFFFSNRMLNLELFK